MAFIIYHLENGISRLFGYSSYVFNFFYLAYFTLVAFFTFEYVYNIYSLTIPFDSINLRAIHAFAEILEQEDILISVRNLYTSEPNYGIEFYPILPRLPRTVPRMFVFVPRMFVFVQEFLTTFYFWIKFWRTSDQWSPAACCYPDGTIGTQSYGTQVYFIITPLLIHFINDKKYQHLNLIQNPWFCWQEMFLKPITRTRFD